MTEEKLDSNSEFFKCHKCPRMYQRKFSLESHMLKKHSQPENNGHGYLVKM